jgi:organic hydroperoxide reductase OsmC/OhrA
LLAPASVILNDLLKVTARVGIGRAKEGGFGLMLALDLDVPRLDPVQATTLMERAHELLPYSGATRGNLDAALTVGGGSIESRAA